MEMTLDSTVYAISSHVQPFRIFEWKTVPGHPEVARTMQAVAAVICAHCSRRRL